MRPAHKLADALVAAVRQHERALEHPVNMMKETSARQRVEVAYQAVVAALPKDAA